MNALINEHGIGVICEEDFKKHRLLESYYRHIGDMLILLADKLMPRELDQLGDGEFRVVRELVEKALK